MRDSEPITHGDVKRALKRTIKALQELTRMYRVLAQDLAFVQTCAITTGIMFKALKKKGILTDEDLNSTDDTINFGPVQIQSKDKSDDERNGGQELLSGKGN